MRFHERAIGIKWKKGTKRADKSNAIDMICSGVVPDTGVEREDWEKNFEDGAVPAIFTPEERKEWYVSDHSICNFVYGAVADSITGSQSSQK